MAVKSQSAWLAYHKAAGTTPTGTYSQYVAAHSRPKSPLLPGGWGRAPDVKGPFATIPQVDIGSFEVGTAGGKFFVRPRTDLTGLDPAYQALFKTMDAQTAAQAGQMQGAYGDYAKQAAQDANSLTTRLGSLSDLAGQAFTPSSAGNPTAGIEAQIAATGQRQQLRDAALQVNTASMLPSIAQRAGLDAVSTYKGNQAATRTKALFDARSAQASIDAATGKLTSTADQAALDRANKLAIAAQSGKTAAAGQAAQDKRAAADRASRERIAAANRAAAAAKAAGGGAAGGKTSTPQGLGAAASAARNLWNGTPDKTAPIGSVDAQGHPITTIPGTGKVAESTKGILGVTTVYSDLRARGLSVAQATKVAQAVVGKALFAQWHAWLTAHNRNPG